MRQGKKIIKVTKRGVNIQCVGVRFLTAFFGNKALNQKRFATPLVI